MIPGKELYVRGNQIVKFRFQPGGFLLLGVSIKTSS
jgi:hypothetical protein